MTEQELVEKVARAMWEDYMIDPHHNGAEMPTWGMLLAGTNRPYAFPEFVNMHRQAMSQARAALSVIREALSEPSEAMKENAALQAMMTDWQDITEDDRVAITAIYRAMIAASPIGEK